MWLQHAYLAKELISDATRNDRVPDAPVMARKMPVSTFNIKNAAAHG
jgi:hypothetical protein